MTLYERTKRHVEDLATAMAEGKFGISATCQIEDEDGVLSLKIYSEGFTGALLKFRYEDFELKAEADTIEDEYEFIKSDMLWQQNISVYNENNGIASKLELQFKLLCELHLREYIASSITLQVAEQQYIQETEEIELLSIGKATDGQIRLFVCVDNNQYYKIKAQGISSFYAVSK